MEDPTAEASIEIAASPEQVYELVSDVVGVPRWAVEVNRCVWKGGATGPAVGAKFRGRNKNSWRSWSTTSKVTAAEPGRRFAFQVYAVGVPTAQWEYEIEPTEGGCRVTERTRRQVPSAVATPANRLLGVKNRDAHNQRNIEATLANLKAFAEQPQ
jgi:uncharacterized protein YndB with AHSA1/START domain